MNLRSLIPILTTSIAVLASPLQAQEMPQGPLVKAIEVQYAGAAGVTKERIMANMKTRVGKPYDDRVVEDDIRSLYASGNISNVRIFGQPSGEGVKVIVVVQSKGTVGDVIINGPAQLKTDRVRKEITTKPGDTLNEASLEADRQKIAEFYASKGYTEASVSYRVDPQAKGPARVTFTVQEGGKVAIRSVNFNGNTAVSRKELLKVVKTKPKGLLDLFSKKGRISNDGLEDDARAIRELYQSKGYIDATVLAPQVSRDGNKADVTFSIREGAQYRVGKVIYDGAQVFPKDQLTKGLKLTAGEVYAPQAAREDIRKMQDLYGSRGYVDTAIGAETSPAGAHTVDVIYRFDEGVQSYLERVNISGNTKTKDKVIRREIAVAPGDVLNTKRVDASKSRLMNLNYFNRVDTFPQDTGTPGRKDLNVIVDEKRTGTLNFGAGFSSIDNLLGFVEVTQSNFDTMGWPSFTGGGQKFRLRAQYGTRRKDFILSLTDPYFLDYKFSLGGELFYRDASYVSDVYDERRYGFALNSRIPINEFTFARAGLRVENIGIHGVEEDAPIEIVNEEIRGDDFKTTLSVGVTNDTRDDVFLTRKGHKVSGELYYALGDPDTWGFSLEGAKYFNLPGDLILTLDGEISSVSPISGSDEDVRIWDRLYLGGPNSLRGFRFRDVSPRSVSDEDEPIGGNTLARGTIELTFPVVERVRGAVFYDVGFVNSGSLDFSPSEIASDAGIGVRVEVPGLGPIRIDYGIPLQKPTGTDGGGRFQFNIGYQF